MTTYTNVFGGTVVYSSDVSYRAVSLTANTQLSWPTELATNTNVVSQIMNVTATSGPWQLKMPEANDASVGETTLIFNVGSNAFTVTDAGGNTIVSIAPGLAYQIFLIDNTTANGTWSQVNYGAGTSSATAGSLAGAGIKAIGTSLNQSMGVTTFSVDYTFQVTPDRSNAFIWTGGAGTATLPLASNAGNDWFVHLRNNGTGAIALTPSGSDLINGSASLTFNPGDSAIVTCSGTGWYTIGFGQAAEFTFDYDSISLTGETSPYSLSGANLNRIAYNFGGTLLANMDIIVPTTIQQYWVTNSTAGGYDIVVKTLAGTGITVANGESAILYCNGTNVVDADSSGVAYPISVANGGTGATNATDARTNLSAAKSGVNGDITQITALADGGASGPAVTFASENNTGMFRVGAGSLGFSILGTQEANLTASGFNLATGNAFSINATSVLNATTLGSGVVNSSLTSVGTLTSGALGTGFTTVAVAQGGTGATSLTSGYLLKGNGTSAVSASVVYDDGTNVGIGTSSPGAKLDVSTGTNSTVQQWQGAGTNFNLKLTSGNAASTNVMAYRLALDYLSGTFTNSFIDFYRGAAGNDGFLTFGTTGTEVMRLDASGNVGIGTTSPVRIFNTRTSSTITARFESTSTDSIIELVNSGTNSTTRPSVGSFNTNMLFSTNGSERARIDSSGNLGLGTSSPLSVAGYKTLSINDTSGGALALYVNGTIAGSIASFSNDIYYDSVDATIWRNGAAFNGAPTERMRLDASGNLGIGTSSVTPVFGTTVKIYNAGNGGTLEVGGSTVNARFLASQGLGIAALGTSTNHPLLFSTNDTERMRIDGSGNLGVGTSSPSHPLDVFSTSNGIVRVGGGSSLNQGAAYYVKAGGSSNTLAAFGDRARILGGTPDQAVSVFSVGGVPITFDAGGSEKMRLDASGNLGIGTSSPGAKLEVYDTSNAQALAKSTTGYAQFQANNTSGSFHLAIDNSTGAGFGAGNYGRVLYSTGAYPMAFFTNAAERMRLDASGNLGLGTASPAFTLDISQTAPRIRQTATTGTNSSLVQLANSGGNAYLGLDNSGGGLGGAYALNVWHSGAYPIVFATNNTERARIDSSGNVGIGTGGTAAKLHVTGTEIRLQGSASYFSFFDNAGTTRAGYIQNASGALSLVGELAQPMVFYTSNTERARIDSSGNLLVGTTSGSSKVTVAGTVESTSGGFKFPDATTQTTKGIAAAFTQITSTSASGTAVTFSNIPQTYTEIYAEITDVSHNGGTSQGLRIQVSTDGVTYTTALNVGPSVAAANSVAGIFSAFDYSRNYVEVSTGVISSANASPYAGFMDSPLLMKITGGIKYVSFVWSGGASFDAGTITLYGR